MVSGLKDQSIKVKVKAFLEWYVGFDYQDILIAITKRRVLILADEATHQSLDPLIDHND